MSHPPPPPAQPAMQYPPPPATTVPGAPVTAAAAAAPSAAANGPAPDAAASAAAAAAAPPARLFYGSLEGTLRAQGASAAAAAAQPSPPPAAAAATGPRAPVSFNNRTALLSTQLHAHDAASATNKGVSESVRLGMASGNINVSGVSADTFALSEATQQAMAAQSAQMREMEIAKRARSVVVPTNDNLVRKRLRELGEPITLFGERIPGRRERLSGVLARKHVEEAHAAALAAGGDAAMADASAAAASAAAAAAAAEPAKEAKAFLTPGTEELRQARLYITSYSLARARSRLDRERAERDLDNKDPSGRLAARQARVARLASVAPFSSEIGDARPLSSLSFSPCSTRLATASWSGLSKVWSIAPSTSLQFELKGHAGNVTDIAWRPAPQGEPYADGVQLASCGMDATVILWKLPDNSQQQQPGASAANGAANGDANDTEMSDASTPSIPALAVPATTADAIGLPAPATPVVSPAAVLRGHGDRCSRLAFHPSGRYVASTSFDKTWRLWDLAAEKEVLKQPGHAEATYAAAFHPDGSLLVSGDLGGVGQLWDLRTGKSIVALTGHAKQMLAADFHPGGTLLATASDDHTVRVWDLRAQAGALYTIGAHSSLISNVRWEPREGLYLLTSSYDRTTKLWHGTDFSLIKTLAGHESKVMRAEISPDSSFIATSGYDRTWKLWVDEGRLA